MQHLGKLPSMATEFIVVKETVVLPANSGQLFMGASNLRAIEGANKFDTSSVTHMNWMFWECKLRGKS